MPNVFKAPPHLHSRIKPIGNNTLVRLQAFDKTALARTIVANQHRQRRELYHPAVLDSLEILEPKRFQRQLLCHLNTPFPARAHNTTAHPPH